jgi:hypothetical protein
MHGSLAQESQDSEVADIPVDGPTPSAAPARGRSKSAPEDGNGRRVSELRGELDRLSLEQSLIDFDVANARVVDLTQRLIDAAQEVARLRAELDALRVAQAGLQSELAATRSTKAFRIAEKIWELRRALHV